MRQVILNVRWQKCVQENTGCVYMDRMNGVKKKKRCGSYSSLDQSSTLTAGPMVRDDRCSLTDSMGLSRDACSSSNWPSSYWSKWFPPWVTHLKSHFKKTLTFGKWTFYRSLPCDHQEPCFGSVTTSEEQVDFLVMPYLDQQQCCLLYMKRYF